MNSPHLVGVGLLVGLDSRRGCRVVWAEGAGWSP